VRIRMNEGTDEQRLLVAAIATVLMEEAKGGNLEPSTGRAMGRSWSIDHRRSLLGRDSLEISRSKRSSTR